MLLQTLSIINYKNIEQADLSFSRKINCFIGSNGEGKTNLLDAVYFLSFCKSATNSIDSQVVRHGADMLMLQARYEADDGTEEEIACGVRPHSRKVFRHNKKAYKRLAEHIGLIPLVAILPNDYRLIAGGSDERRLFMDSVISQYDTAYLNNLIKYNRALQQRNSMLKQEAEPDASMLDLYEDVMASEGEQIYAKRAEFVKELVPIFAEYYEKIACGHEEVSLAYQSECVNGSLLDAIRTGRAKDRLLGYSLHGIHRDELVMLIDQYPIRRVGSQGQNKSFLIALKLAQFAFLHKARKETPILLLDDFFDKLDADRVERIVRIVADTDFGQIFITDTNREHLDNILAVVDKDYRLFNVKDGKISL